MGGILWRTAVILHRYLGVAIGLLMVMWFVSGIVMMYVPFTQVADTERLRFQPPISWQFCCRYGGLSDEATVIRAQVENHLGAPAMRLRIPGQPDSLFDLAQGARVPIDADVARKVVSEAAPNVIKRSASIVAYDQVPFDQFTLGRAQRDLMLPVYRVILADEEQTRYYLDPNTGALLQRADATGRWHRWLFSGLHRLDFTEWMRTRPFRDILMWLTLLGGIALSVTGVYLAVRRARSDIIVLLRSLRRLFETGQAEKQVTS